MTFGIWNTITGKIYPSDESRVTEDFSTYTVEDNTLLAVPKDYINSEQNEEEMIKEQLRKDISWKNECECW